MYINYFNSLFFLTLLSCQLKIILVPLLPFSLSLLTFPIQLMGLQRPSKNYDNCKSSTIIYLYRVKGKLWFYKKNLLNYTYIEKSLQIVILPLSRKLKT